MTVRPPILPPAVGLLMMLGIFTLHFIKPMVVLFHYPFNYIGLLPISVGALLNILAERELERKAKSSPAGAEINNDILVTSGVFRLSRNPSYLGVVLVIAGLALWVGSLSPWLIVLGTPCVLRYKFIKEEEADLLARFGHRYQQYCRLVPRWMFRNSNLSE